MKLCWPFRVEEIFVHVHPERFHFQSPRQSFELPTVVGDGDAGLARALPGSAPVVLLQPSHDLEAPCQPRALVVFLEHAFLRCMDDRVVKLTPHVVFLDASSLDPLLSGFQYDVLRQAAFRAGARTVRFEGEIVPAEYSRRAGRKPAPRYGLNALR